MLQHAIVGVRSGWIGEYSHAMSVTILCDIHIHSWIFPSVILVLGCSNGRMHYMLPLLITDFFRT
jgi:hypothetical protein